MGDELLRFLVEVIAEFFVERKRDKGTIGQAVLRTGDARDSIIQAAEELHADLIVMGTHGRRGVSRALLGSIAETVVRSAPCPVLTVRNEPAA